MSGGIGRQRSGEGQEFRFRFVGSSFLEQELDEFDAGLVAVGIRVGLPDSIHGIVVVTSGVFNGAAVGGYASEREIDGGILWCTLPKRQQVGFSFVETAMRLTGIVAVAQGTSQAELVLRVVGIAGEGGAEGGDGVIVAASAGLAETHSVKLASAGLLIGGEAGHEVANRSERKDGCECQQQKYDRRGARDEFGGRPRHVSDDDIILRGWAESGEARTSGAVARAVSGGALTQV